MLKKFLIGLSTLLLLVLFVNAYTAPSYDSITSNIQGGYTANPYNAVQSVISPVAPSDSCTYGGSGDWNINSSDHCNLTLTDLNGNKAYLDGSTAHECCTTGFITNLTNYTYREANNAYLIN